MEKKRKRCKIAKNVEFKGKRYKVVDFEDSCSSVNKVLAKHEGSKIITPAEYEKMKLTFESE